MLEVESGGKDDAVGDNGKAIGPYQTWEVYWRDAVEYEPSIGGKYSDCKNRAYAERIVVAYLNRYAPKGATYETLARIHNGGPTGYKKSKTIKYWNKIKKVLYGRQQIPNH